jgi:hypothetical protein
MMSLTSFGENRNGLGALVGDVPENPEPSQERVAVESETTRRVRSPAQAWASGNRCSGQNVPPQ